MRTTFTRSQASSKRKSASVKWGLIALAVVVVLLILVGAASLGAYFLLREQPFDVPEWQDPLSLVNVDRVDPAVAVAGLGGVSDGDLSAKALAQARADTAYAILVFSPSIGDRESAGDFLLLASRYRTDNRPEYAIACYRLAGTIATLSPELPDTVRADTFVLAGEGLADLGQFGLAQLYLDQAFNIATASPYLQAATRRNMFQRLHLGYQAIGDRERARISLKQSAEPFPVVTLVEASPVLPVAEPPLLPLEVQQAEATRWDAAQALARALVERGGRAPAELVADLRETLLAEDEAKLPCRRAQAVSADQRCARAHQLAVHQISRGAWRLWHQPGARLGGTGGGHPVRVDQVVRVALCPVCRSHRGHAQR